MVVGRREEVLMSDLANLQVQRLTQALNDSARLPSSAQNLSLAHSSLSESLTHANSFVGTDAHIFRHGLHLAIGGERLGVKEAGTSLLEVVPVPRRPDATTSKTGTLEVQWYMPG